jgi:hypothetical protein
MWIIGTQIPTVKFPDSFSGPKSLNFPLLFFSMSYAANKTLSIA